MKTIACLLLVVATAAPLAAQTADRTPPPVNANGLFVDADACPFECCTYRTWTVEVDAAIFDQPIGGRPVGVARAGETVEGLGGAVYTRPVPVDVAFAHTGEAGVAFARGERFWLLTYAGEGYSRIWHKNTAKELDIAAIIDSETGKLRSCATPSAQCWWTIRPEFRERQSFWRVRVRLRSGIEGWTAETENFSGVDACG